MGCAYQVPPRESRLRNMVAHDTARKVVVPAPLPAWRMMRRDQSAGSRMRGQVRWAQLCQPPERKRFDRRDDVGDDEIGSRNRRKDLDAPLLKATPTPVAGWCIGGALGSGCRMCGRCDPAKKRPHQSPVDVAIPFIRSDRTRTCCYKRDRSRRYPTERCLPNTVLGRARLRISRHNQGNR